VIVTADKVPDIDGLEVVTEHNGSICSRDFVRNMKMRPFDLHQEGTGCDRAFCDIMNGCNPIVEGEQ
jgi:hypothetical protein